MLEVWGKGNGANGSIPIIVVNLSPGVKKAETVEVWGCYQGMLVRISDGVMKAVKAERMQM